MTAGGATAAATGAHLHIVRLQTASQHQTATHSAAGRRNAGELQEIVTIRGQLEI